MAIEGPLRELGIHDVFQLLDLSRKTGTLSVTSELRDNDGTVQFRNGGVVAAAIRSNPHRLGELLLNTGRVTEAQLEEAGAAQRQRGDGRRLGDILLEMGAIGRHELERHARLQIEAVVFELLSWREGFFRFEEGPVEGDAAVQIGTAALLMEGARRIDEWSRISGRVPTLLAIPRLTSLTDDRDGAALDLQPGEWEVLARIDGTMDLRAIAASLARTEFETAKVVYGLVSTGVVELEVPPTVAERMAARGITPALGVRTVADAPPPAAIAPAPLPAERPDAARPAEQDEISRGCDAVRLGDLAGAADRWGAWLSVHPDSDTAATIREGREAAVRLRAIVEALAP